MAKSPARKRNAASKSPRTSASKPPVKGKSTTPHAKSGAERAVSPRADHWLFKSELLIKLL